MVTSQVIVGYCYFMTSHFTAYISFLLSFFLTFDLFRPILPVVISSRCATYGVSIICLLFFRHFSCDASLATTASVGSD
jgi:hypothetical protein